ncbi:dicarboxylate/amino acid:cation symporter [Salinifilum aidingensis]
MPTSASSTAPSAARRRFRFNPKIFAVLVLASLVAGAGLGWLARATGADWLTTALDTIGSTFTNLLTFTVLPLIFTAIVVGINSLRNIGGGRTAARLGGKTALWFATTSFIAVIIGLVIGRLFQPGDGTSLAPDPENVREVGEKSAGSWLDLLTGLVPDNLVSAFADGETLQVVFIALLVGAATYSLGDKAAPFVSFNRSLFEIIQRILGWIIRLAPLGTLGLIGNAVATYGNEFFAPLLKLTGATYVACALVLLVVYPVLLATVARVSPLRFFSKAWTVLQFAFVSRSSSATLPLSRQTAENLGVQPAYANFAVPLATTTKMDGCAAIYPAIGSIFIANMFGIELGATQYVIIVLVAVFGAIATAGVTGWFTMLTLTVSALGFPPQVVATGIAIAYAVDPILDMMRTMTNVAGQIVVPTVVARTEGLIDDERLHQPSEPPLLNPEAEADPAPADQESERGTGQLVHS